MNDTSTPTLEEMTPQRGLAYSAVTDLRWADRDKTAFNAMVTFDLLGQVPFTCGAYDSEAHAVDIYARALAGDFGTIAEYVEMAPAAADHRAAVASRRYMAETAGITVQGMAIATDRASQALITGATVAAMRDAAYSCQWKTADGFVKLTAAQILGIDTAVRAHIQGCFDREAELLTAIADASFTSAMLEQGWPDAGDPRAAA